MYRQVLSTALAGLLPFVNQHFTHSDLVLSETLKGYDPKQPLTSHLEPALQELQAKQSSIFSNARSNSHLAAFVDALHMPDVEAGSSLPPGFELKKISPLFDYMVVGSGD